MAEEPLGLVGRAPSPFLWILFIVYRAIVTCTCTDSDLSPRLT